MKPCVFHPDDGSVLIEWIDADRRFGISIEKNRSESGWYYVDKNGAAESGELPKELLDMLKQRDN